MPNDKLLEIMLSSPGGTWHTMLSVGGRLVVHQLLPAAQQAQLSFCRNPAYNGVRIFFTVIFGLLVGAIYWRLGKDR